MPLTTNTHEINQKVSNIVNRIDGKVGIYAHHSKGLLTYGLNENESFPLASLDKIPIALKVLSQVKNKQLTLDQYIDILPSDLRPGTGILSKRLSLPGVALSLANLIRLLLEMSDNTASDILLRLAGGPDAVTQFLSEIGAIRTRIGRSCLQSFAKDAGIANLPYDAICTPELYERIQAFGALGTLDESKKDFSDLHENDLDTTTPLGFTKCLLHIYDATLLGSELSRFMLDSMAQCQTGRARMMALLPPNTKVAHKTGTLSRATNDAGLITLPEKDAYLFLSVLIKDSSAPLAEKESIIAEVAQLLFKYATQN